MAYQTENRMTSWSRGKYVLPQGRGTWRRIAERLAAYENCGLEPKKLNWSIYERRDGDNLSGDITVCLSEEDRIAITNALEKAAWNEEDFNENFARICALICKIGGMKEGKDAVCEEVY